MKGLRVIFRHWVWIIGLVLIGVSVAGFFLVSKSPVRADKEAAEVVEKCAAMASRSECYEALVPHMYPRLSVAHIFDVVRSIRKQDSSYQFCHVLGHKIGEAVVAHDPDHWRDAIAYNPRDSLCSNGYIHGVVGGRFRAEVLDDATIEKFIPDFSLACEPSKVWHPTSFDSAVCYHGMGHLYDFITDANLLKAVDLCHKTIPLDGQRICIQGVFMQIYQPLEPDDYQLIARMKTKPTKETVRAFCATFKHPVYVGSCLEESWPMFREEILSGTGVKAFCSGYPNAEEEKYCWQGISAIIGRMSLARPERAEQACNHFPVDWQGTCYAGSAQAVIEEGRSSGKGAVSLCARAAELARSTCYASLARRALSLFGPSEELVAFCTLLPQEYQRSCNQNSPR